MQKHGYYTLVASLPHLPRFNQAERLPITRERLLTRLKMLSPEDYRLAELVAEFIAWRRQPVGRTNAEMASIYTQGVKTLCESPQLQPLFELPVNQKTILVALRRHENGLPRPNPGELWGTGPLVSHIAYNWDQPFFKLRYVYPWIVQAQNDLHTGDTLKLDYLLFNLVWNKLDALLFNNPFGFEAIIAYLLKWDILQQWLTYNQQAAKARFETCLSEAIHDYQQRSH